MNKLAHETCRVLTITLLFGITVQAQSLAEIARRERAKRAAEVGRGRIYTSEDLRAAPVAPAAAQSEEVPETASGEPADVPEDLSVAGEVESGDATEPDPGGDTEEEWAEWEAAGAVQRAVVQDFEDREVRQQLEIDRLRNLVTAPVATEVERAQAQASLDQAQSRFESIQTELEAARATLEKLEASGPGGP